MNDKVIMNAANAAAEATIPIDSESSAADHERRIARDAAIYALESWPRATGHWLPVAKLGPERDDREILVGVWVQGEHGPFWSSWTAYNNGDSLGNDGLYGDEPTHYADIIPPVMPEGKSDER